MFFVECICFDACDTDWQLMHSESGACYCRSGRMASTSLHRTGSLMQIHPNLVCPYHSFTSRAMKHMSSHQLSLLERTVAGVFAVFMHVGTVRKIGASAHCHACMCYAAVSTKCNTALRSTLPACSVSKKQWSLTKLPPCLCRSEQQKSVRYGSHLEGKVLNNFEL